MGTQETNLIAGVKNTEKEGPPKAGLADAPDFMEAKEVLARSSHRQPTTRRPDTLPSRRHPIEIPSSRGHPLDKVSPKMPSDNRRTVFLTLPDQDSGTISTLSQQPNPQRLSKHSTEEHSTSAYTVSTTLPNCAPDSR